ncbi:Zinc finger protein rotund [Gryllus bimaculatus]|nr:Zinc finger protein rotund [Gryllus bimaculatus]
MGRVIRVTILFCVRCILCVLYPASQAQRRPTASDLLKAYDALSCGRTRSRVPPPSSPVFTVPACPPRLRLSAVARVLVRADAPPLPPSPPPRPAPVYCRCAEGVLKLCWCLWQVRGRKRGGGKARDGALSWTGIDHGNPECFSDEPSLLEHIPKHKESKHLKTHICQYCGKSYTQETYLTKHMQKHAERTDKRPPITGIGLNNRNVALGAGGGGPNNPGGNPAADPHAYWPKVSPDTATSLVEAMNQHEVCLQQGGQALGEHHLAASHHRSLLEHHNRQMNGGGDGSGEEWPDVSVFLLGFSNREGHAAAFVLRLRAASSGPFGQQGGGGDGGADRAGSHARVRCLPRATGRTDRVCSSGAPPPAAPPAARDVAAYQKEQSRAARYRCRDGPSQKKEFAARRPRCRRRPAAPRAAPRRAAAAGRAAAAAAVGVYPECSALPRGGKRRVALLTRQPRGPPRAGRRAATSPHRAVERPTKISDPSRHWATRNDPHFVDVCFHTLAIYRTSDNVGKKERSETMLAGLGFALWQLVDGNDESYLKSFPA